MRNLYFALTIDGVDDPTIVVRQFHGCDSISDSEDESGQALYGFRYHIDIASKSPSLTAEQMVDNTALLTVIRDGVVVQKVHGIIRRFSRGDTGYHHSFYSLTLVPSLERLSLRSNSRIFQKKTVQQILGTLLDEMGITDYSFAVKRALQEREFCVQYRETDLEFFHRMAAEEGLMYSFIHDDSKHTLLITDNTDSFPQLDSPVEYNALSGGVSENAFISTLTENRRSEVSSVNLFDYSFKNPTYNFQQLQEGEDDMAYQNQTYEHFDYPGRYKNDTSGSAFSKIRMQYLRRNAYTVNGLSDEARIQSGLRFSITEHLDSSMNRSWLAVRICHKGTQPQALEEMGGHGATTYNNDFVIIPDDLTWRAPIRPKPQVDGPCIATVTGPSGEEIYCDEYGRVTVQFPWDREGQNNEESSCWVRVSQGWAGGQYGFVAIPRIGHEVIVSFLNGDPDQPIITGRTYHTTNTVPYSLPDNKTRTVIRTQTHKGNGYNEIRFEDLADQEEIFIHAQKDQNNVVNNDETTLVKNDRSEQVDHDESIIIGNNRTEQVGVNETITIGVNRTETVGGNEVVTVKGNQAETIAIAKAETVGAAKALTVGAGYQVSVGGAMNRSVGLSDTTQVGGSKSTNVKKKIQYVAGDEISLVTGKSSLVMKSDGTILLNGVDISTIGTGAITVKAAQNLTIKGKKVLEN